MSPYMLRIVCGGCVHATGKDVHGVVRLSYALLEGIPLPLAAPGTLNPVQQGWQHLKWQLKQCMLCSHARLYVCGRAAAAMAAGDHPGDAAAAAQSDRWHIPAASARAHVSAPEAHPT